MTKIDDKHMEKVGGGASQGQGSNTCPRCGSGSYTVRRREADGTEIRICNTCHYEYSYRNW